MQKPKSLDEVMSQAFSHAPGPTVEQETTVASFSPGESSATAEPPPTEISPKTGHSSENSTEAPSTTVAEETTIAPETPARLIEEVTRLKKLLTEEWQPLPENIIEQADYWQGYAHAWHYLEDEVLPHLEKDLKLALRRCYRKAFGKREAGGRFFAGQTGLANEVGLSKRRIQDILETFHLLGWVRKVAHYNRGNRKGTDYQMRLPSQARQIFLNSISVP